VRIAIFAGSSLGNDPRYAQGAADLGRGLASAGVGIVYGGACVGLMGILADAALSVGGEVIGVIPRVLVDREIAHRGLSNLEVVDTLHERKARILSQADACVALPGGPGTLDEFFEALTWLQLGFHGHACAMYDVADFHTSLLAHMDRMSESGFLPKAHLDNVGVVSDVRALLAFIGAHKPPPAKWDVTSRNGHAHTRPLSPPEVIDTVALVKIRDDRLLTVRTRGRSAFYVPGGKLCPGEDPPTALAREVSEELGLDLDVSTLRHLTTIEAPADAAPPGTIVRMACFEGTIFGDPAPHREIAEMAWLPLCHASRCAPAVQRLMHWLSTTRRLPLTLPSVSPSTLGA
jgi:uncharacterized protein (TIGR00730 family)